MRPAIVHGAWFILATALALSPTRADWEPAEAPLMTRWSADVDPDSVLPEYPRPQLVRERWQNLNGLWQYAIRPRTEPQPQDFDGEILVPIPVEQPFQS